MEEVHHIHKLDHPSGTAITIAEELIEVSNKVDNWKEPAENAENDDNAENVENAENTLYISHRREGEVPGIHTVIWDSPQDTITISHSAKSREGFALGAVLAAEWLAEKCKKFSVGPLKLGSGQTGFFTMKDMLKF